jgi:chromosome segregation ATPase
MKINDILNEAGDDSGDYQQMLAFTRANRVGGVPDDQQIPLALFKELKKQQQQNQALGAELDAAEQRIDQATQSGELSKKELGMHRGELDRERAAGVQQKAAIGQLGQQYAEREKASTEQVQDLAQRLEAVKNMPGVNKDSVDRLEKQIQELGKTGIGAEKVEELERSIAAIQSAESTDDAAIKDLIQQVKAAQAATAELSKTKQTVSKDAEETANKALDQIEQIKQQLSRFKEVEDATQLVKLQVNQLAQSQAKLADKVDTVPIAVGQANKEITQRGASSMMSTSPQMSLPGVETPASDAGNQLELPGVNQPQAEPDVARNLVGRIKQANPVDKAAVYESQLQNAIAWATGKRK